MTPPRFTTDDATLGIELAQRAGGYHWRHVHPAPPCGWYGPYATPEQAHASALAYLLHLAHGGAILRSDWERAAASVPPEEIDLTLPQQASEDDEPPPAWWGRAFESGHE